MSFVFTDKFPFWERGKKVINSKNIQKGCRGIRNDERAISENSCEIRFTTGESKGGGHFKDRP